MQSFNEIPLLVTEEILRWEKSKFVNGGHIRQLFSTKFGRAQLDHWEHSRQVWKESEEWSWRRCDNKIVILLNKGEVTIFKMAVWQPYYLMNGEVFLERHI